jgi:LysM repeat protein
MNADIPSSERPVQRQIPLVKTESMEWSGETMRSEMQATLFILIVLVVLTGLLLIIVPAQLRAMAQNTPADSAGSSTEASINVNTVSCVPRTDWATYPIQPDDSLSELARRTGISVTMLADSNCLGIYELQTGNTLYLPAVPAGTQF